MFQYLLVLNTLEALASLVMALSLLGLLAIELRYWRKENNREREEHAD